jgi:hypothetical protein
MKRPTLITRTNNNNLKLTFERTEFVNDDHSKNVTGTGEYTVMDCDLIVRAIGYKNLPCPGVQFDTQLPKVKNDQGRVLLANGNVHRGVYVSGYIHLTIFTFRWLKTGPTGVIATTMYQSQITADYIIKDFASGDLSDSAKPGRKGLMHILTRPNVFNNQDWLDMDALEMTHGSAYGRPRIKLDDPISFKKGKRIH